MSLYICYSSTAGARHAFAWLYFAYLLTLLVDRQLRDERRMEAAYGAQVWKRFTHRVPYRLVPFLF